MLANNSLVGGNFQPADGDPYGIPLYDPSLKLVLVDVDDEMAELSLSDQRVVATPALGPDPGTMAYDPTDDELFVPEPVANEVIVASSSTLETLATIPVGMGPSAAVYDSGTGDIFVTNWGSSNVSVISPSTDTVIGTVAVGLNPVALAYDSVRDEVAVANLGSDNVTFISDSTYSSVAEVPVGTYPSSIAFDSAKGEEVVTNSGSNNISVISDSSHTVTQTIAQSGAPQGVAYDPAQGEWFVTDGGDSELSVLSDSNDSTVATVDVGQFPEDVSYDAANGTIITDNANGWSLSLVSDVDNQVIGTVETGTKPVDVVEDTQTGVVFVANLEDNQILGISPQTNLVVSDTSVDFPFALAYDSHTQDVYSTNGLTGAISEFNASTAGPVVEINTTDIAYSLAYDSAQQEVFVGSYTYSYTGIVQVIDDSTQRIVANISVPYAPTGIAYDSGTDQLFVACYYGNVVEVIDGANNAVVKQIPLSGYPATATYDPSRGVVYVSDFNTDQLTAISDATDQILGNISVGEWPEGSTVDPQDGLVFVANSGSDNVSVISDYTDTLVETVDVGGYPWFDTYDPTSDEVYIACQSSGTVSILGPIRQNSVTFDETGSPGGQNWGVDLEGNVNLTSNSSVSYELIDGTYSYSIIAPAGYVSNPANGVLIVDGANLTVYVNVSEPISLIFTETGLPLGTSWWVNLSSGQSNVSSQPSIDFQVANGTLQFTIGTSDNVYAAKGGELTIVGLAVNVPVLFVPFTSPLNFIESGLPSGTSWWVNISSDQSFNSSGTSIQFNETNGSYEYNISSIAGFGAAPSSGTLEVTGRAIETSVSFSRQYSVRFIEAGLPTGTAWWVNLTDGGSYKSTNQSIQFVEANGTYPFVVESSDRSYSAPGGVVTVDGSPISEEVTFSLVQYDVTFTESGLPAGTGWWVNITGGPSLRATDGSLATGEPNGTYSYTESTVNKSYSASGGSFRVAGSSVGVSVLFSLVTYAVTMNEAGLPSGTEWWVNLTDGMSANSTGSTVSILLSNGSYSFSVATSNKEFAATGGSLEVDGTATSEMVSFSKVEYAIDFHETGLPAGVTWWVNLSEGQSFFGTGPSLVLTEPNGTYRYSVSSVGWQSSLTSGTFEVTGEAITQSLSFSEVTYEIVFTETGLPNGTSWSISLDGSMETSLTDTLVFAEPNATYSYVVGTVAGYNANVTSGSVLVHGTPESVSLGFVATPPSSATKGGSAPSGLSYADWLLIGAAAAAFAAAAAALVVRRRRRAASRVNP